MAYISRRYAGYFDGVDDKVTVTNTFNFDNPTTVFVAFRPVGKTSENSICGNFNDDVSGYNGWFLRISAGAVNLQVWDSGTSYGTSADVVSLGSLYSVGIVSHGKGNGADVWVNGYKSVTHPYGLVNDSSAFMIGNRSSVAPSAVAYNGDIRVVYIWNRVLSDSELSKLYEDPYNRDNISTDGLVAWWDFNKADWTNGVLTDLSGNGNDGTISGTTQIDTLVKRGTGNLPKYDLTHAWVCDGIDDYVQVDANNWALTKSLNIGAWVNNYAGGLLPSVVSSYASGIGYYDSTNDAWRVDAGSVGYFFEREVGYLDTKFGKNMWLYISGVKVDDNTITDKLLRVELIDLNSGSIVFEHVYTADEFPSDSFSGIVTAGRIMVPYGRYAIRLFSYASTGFWIKNVNMDGYHSTLFSSVDDKYKFKKYYGQDRLELVKSDGSVVSVPYIDNSIHEWEHVLFGWDVVRQSVELYVNGANAKSVADDSGVGISYTSDSAFVGLDSVLASSTYYVGEIASIQLYDRMLSDTEVDASYSREFILDGLIHWWIVDSSGNLIDLVTGKTYTIQGSPYIRRLYDADGNLNSGTGAIVFDIIKEERGE